MRRDLVSHSKFLSLVLRHRPAVVGIELDESGWVDVEVLLQAIRRKRPGLTRAVLEEVVATNDKGRFVLSDDRQRIRAAQGHTIGVDLGHAPVVPPELLFHGTAERHLASIRCQGLLPQGRDHVHLSADRDTANQVGARHGRPVVLIVEARRMHAAGHAFYLADNGVWLTRAVPPDFIADQRPSV